jgi:hypothetical protein
LGEGRGALALSAAVPASVASDRVGEVTLAAATVAAAALLVLTLPVLVRRARGRAGVTPALVIATGGAAITFVAYLAFAVRCTQAGCHFGKGDTVAGLAPWWRIKGAWQWGAQLALASVALLIASAALALAVREKRAAAPVVTLARLAYGVWTIVVFVIPAAWEIFVI